MRGSGRFGGEQAVTVAVALGMVLLGVASVGVLVGGRPVPAPTARPPETAAVPPAPAAPRVPGVLTDPEAAGRIGVVQADYRAPAVALAAFLQGLGGLDQDDRRRWVRAYVDPERQEQVEAFTDRWTATMTGGTSGDGLRLRPLGYRVRSVTRAPEPEVYLTVWLEAARTGQGSAYLLVFGRVQVRADGAPPSVTSVEATAPGPQPGPDAGAYFLPVTS